MRIKLGVALVPALIAALVVAVAVSMIGPARAPAGLSPAAEPIAAVVEPVRSVRHRAPASGPPAAVAVGADRVFHRAADGSEWLFVQNPRDRRRVSATRIDRKRRLLVEYSDSELQMAGLARGWADVAALGHPDPAGATPSERFPDYALIDAADEREQLHDRATPGRRAGRR